MMLQKKRAIAPPWNNPKKAKLTDGFHVTYEFQNSYTQRKWYFVEQHGAELAGPFSKYENAYNAAVRLMRSLQPPKEKRPRRPPSKYSETLVVQHFAILPCNERQPLTCLGNVHTKGTRVWRYAYIVALDLVQLTLDGKPVEENFDVEGAVRRHYRQDEPSVWAHK